MQNTKPQNQMYKINSTVYLLYCATMSKTLSISEAAKSSHFLRVIHPKTLKQIRFVILLHRNFVDKMWILKRKKMAVLKTCIQELHTVSGTKVT